MTLHFRLIDESDFSQFAAWLAQPHVQKWWKEPATVEHVSAEYGAQTRGDDRVGVYMIYANDRAIGIIQVYCLDDEPEYGPIMEAPGMVSIDYMIGEPDLIGRGIGTQMIHDFIEQIVKSRYPEATGVATAVEVGNAASRRILEKNGFVPYGEIIGEYGPEVRLKLAF